MPEQTFIAFAASDRLHNNTDGFIKRMAEAHARPEPTTMEAIMVDFTSEALYTFFTLPTRNIGLSNTMKKVVQLSVDTIKGASNMVIRRTAPNLNLEQHREAAAYMDKIRIAIPDQQGNDIWHVAFPLSEELEQQGRLALQQLEENRIHHARENFVDYLLGLTDESLYWYFEQPIDLLHLGPILRKLCKVGTETARKASQTSIRRVFSRLEEPQLREIAGFIDALMVSCEPRPGQL